MTKEQEMEVAAVNELARECIRNEFRARNAEYTGDHWRDYAAIGGTSGAAGPYCPPNVMDLVSLMETVLFGVQVPPPPQLETLPNETTAFQLRAQKSYAKAIAEHPAKVAASVAAYVQRINTLIAAIEPAV